MPVLFCCPVCCLFCPASCHLVFFAPDEEKAAIKKHESRFITMDPQAMYTIDRINNGLYR